MKSKKYPLVTLQDTKDLAVLLAKAIYFPLTCYLQGDIGIGKTTLVQNLLAKLGVTEAVVSPTFTLMQHYQVDKWEVLHLDLYRIEDPEELVYLNLPQFMGKQTLALIEWPELGGQLLPAADLHIFFTWEQETRIVEIQANNPKANALLAAIVSN